MSNFMSYLSKCSSTTVLYCRNRRITYFCYNCNWLHTKSSLYTSTVACEGVIGNASSSTCSVYYLFITPDYAYPPILFPPIQWLAWSCRRMEPDCTRLAPVTGTTPQMVSASSSLVIADCVFIPSFIIHRELYHQMGEQVHVLHCDCLWTGHLDISHKLTLH